MRLWVAAVVVGVAYGGCAPSRSDPDPVDTDGDGLSDTDELVVYGTSPLLADTDGDGMSDKVEIVDRGFDPAIDPYRFNPRIADVAEMELAFTSSPTIRVIVTETNGLTHTLQDTRSDLDSVTDTTSSSAADNRSTSVSTPTTVTRAQTQPAPAVDAGRADAGAADGATDAAASDAAAAPARPTITDTVSSTYNPTTAAQTTLTFSDQEARQNAVTLSLAEAWAAASAETQLSGTLKVTASIENHGRVAFRVTNVVLSATLVKGDANAVPLGNLTIDTPWLTSVPFSLAPGEETGAINFIKTGLPLEPTLELVRDQSNLGVRLGLYEICDEDGTPYSFQMREVHAKTAAIVIDYGGRRPAEHYLVATKLDGARPGITAGRAFDDVLRVPVDSDTTGGLVAVRDVAADPTGGDRWGVARTRDDGIAKVTTRFGDGDAPYDFRAIELQAGDMLRIAWAGR